MTEIAELTLDQISALIYEVMIANGCDDANAAALADIMSRAERDGSHSHGSRGEANLLPSTLFAALPRRECLL